jgi:hypothetical protein
LVIPCSNLPSLKFVDAAISLMLYWFTNGKTLSINWGSARTIPALESLNIYSSSAGGYEIGSGTAIFPARHISHWMAA